MKKLLLIVGLVLAIAIPAFAKPSGSRSGSRSYGGSSRTSSPSKSTPSKPASTPKKSHYDGAAKNDAKQESSKRSFFGGKKSTPPPAPPKPTYTTATGQKRELNTSDPRVSRIRDTYSSPSYFNTRSQRMQSYYGPRYNDYYSRPAPMFGDGMSPLFWYFLLDQTFENKAQHIYHHGDQMDPARVKEMYTKDAQLEARVKQLETEAKAKDPNFVVGGIDPDLMYTDAVIKATTQPVVQPKKEGWGFWGWACTVISCMVLCVPLVWLVLCFLRWRRERKAPLEEA